MLTVSLRYAQVYTIQFEFLLTCAIVAVVFALFARIRLSKYQRLSSLIACYEAVCAFGIAASAVSLQGDLWGRPSNYSTDPTRYNIQHGMWHVQLALVVSLLNVRFRDILDQSRQGVKEKAHIRDVAILGLYGLGVYFVQSIVLAVLKQADAPESSLVATLWVGTVLLTLHTVRLAVVEVFKIELTKLSDVTGVATRSLPFVRLSTLSSEA